ncbi:MAG: ABC transporter ATP-binding protein, partial [Pseudarthrobacter sp.]
IKAYRAESLVLRRLTARADALADLGVSASRVESMLVPAVTLGQQIALVGVLVGGGTRVIAGDLDLPTYIAFLLYLLQMVGPVVMAVSGLTTIQGGMIARGRFENVFALPTEKAFKPEPDAGGTEAPQQDALRVGQEEKACAVSFSGVSFGYGDGAPVLQDVNFDVPTRGLTALVGLSGSGKTTILDLIERFALDHSGAITFFGHPIEDLSLSKVRQNTAYVDQSFTLVHGTVRENLNLGRESEVPERRLAEVLQMVGLDETIAALGDGLDTEIGGSTDLSGGQRQRLALARAILSDAPLVLLDEPSSQLDGVNEEKLRLCVREMARDRAVLMVAHRISTVQHASKIIVLDRGQVAAEGTHEELLHESPAYTLLVTEQTLNRKSETDEGQLVPL